MKKTKTSKYGRATAEFLALAYSDYLASRVLINANLLPPGAMLASTAIEKYFKAILAFRGNVSVGHLKKAHINAAKNFDSELASKLNDEFLELLRRAYRLRYMDQLKDNFNLVVASREFLAELDFTAFRLQAGFSTKQGEIPVVQDFHVHKQNNDVRLFSNNYVLAGLDKQEFISRESQWVYEVRRCPIRGLLEARYVTGTSQSNGHFLREGYKPLDDIGSQYKFAFIPLPDFHEVTANTFRLRGRTIP